MQLYLQSEMFLLTSVDMMKNLHRHKLSFEEYFTQYIEDKNTNSDGTISNQNDSHTSPMNSNSQPVKKNKFVGLLPLATLKNSAEVNSKLSKISQN